uniref:Afadin n=1 Tax=Schistosoma mansoni TaxID=6183 RepID=A0A5K4F2G2_SCHMA
MGYLSDRRKRLIEQVLEWNSSRLDLFELTIPDEKCEFNGVMRFFLQDENRKFRTKCIRVSSSSRTSEVAEVLKEKFCIQEPSVTNKRFGIYEHHPNGVRRLTNDEYPLLVQLSWSKLGREGKFVLKLEPNSGHIQKNVSEIQNGTNLLNDPNNNSNVCGSVINSKTRLFPRLWSFRREKITSPMTVKTDERRKQPLGCAAGVGLSKTSRSIFNTENSLICLLGSIKHHGSGDNIIHRNNNNKNSISPNPDTLPNSSFTRTISDPETAMQQKRQRTLEAKFMQMLHHDNIGSGGTLRIYGGQLFPEIPYKTLLISITDNVGYIIRESLNKYGLDEADPDAYCLVMRKRNSHDILTGLVGVEEILSDDLCPLEYLLTSLSTNNPSSSSSTVVGTKSFGNTVITFEHKNHQNDLDLHSNMNLANSKTENIITTPTTTTTTACVNHKPHSFDSCPTVDNGSATYTYSINDGSNKNNNCPSPQLFDHDNNNTIPSTNLKSTNVLIDSGSSNLVNTIYSVITKTDPPIHNNKPGSTSPKTSVSDRLPCQMAFAPTTLEQLLDWIITKQLKFVHQLRNSHHHTTTTTTTNNNNQSDVTIDLCPLGPAMCVYLMLRAICRQCDRWETIELKQLAKNSDRKVDTNKTTKGKNHSLKNNTNNGELALNQLKRRQRHLLSLLMSVIKRFHDFELYVYESIKRIDLNYSDIEIERNYSTTKSLPPPLLSDVDRKFIDLIKSVTAWLANASQLLHLITCDIDFNATFKFPVDELCQWSPYSFDHDDNNTVKSSNITTTTSWNQLKEQLAEIVQTAFVYLADLCVLRLDLIAIPQLLLYLTKSVQILSNHHYENCMTDSNTSKDSPDSCFPDQQSLDNNNNSSVEINERAWINSNSHCPEKQQQYSKMLNSKHNITLKILSEILNCLHSAYVNPAFIVQLFAHLLHRLNARLFNFIIGYDCEKNQLINNSTHISPIWGKCLYNWIHLCLSDWASAHGLRLATECYLQRISQAADLMLCDMKSVESLYNLTVDLVSLNSRQVQIILENYQLINANNETAELIQNSQSSGTITMDESNLTQQQQIPRAWIEFVVSGVKMVADRILTEENGCHLTTNDEFDGASENPTKSSSSSSRHLEVGESLDLRLPFLLPEDCYPSDNPVPISNNHANHNESIISYEDDSGIYSQSNSFKHQLSSSNETLNATFITVDSIKQFLYPAIQIGWCRLLIRPNIYPANDFLFDEKISVNHSPRKQFLQWNVYLSIDSKIPVNCNDRGKDNIDVTRLNKHLVVVSNGFTTEEKIKCKTENATTYSNNTSIIDNNNKNSSELVKNHSLLSSSLNRPCSRHCTYSVVVPKIGSSLGLSIVAAISEYGEDLGIYVRGINPGSGASQAKLIHCNNHEINPLQSDKYLLTSPYLQIGDRLISVNGQSITGLTQDDALKLVASTTDEVVLTVVRYAKQDAEYSTSTLITATKSFSKQPSSQLTSMVDSESKVSDLQCIDCLLHESLLSNYKEFVKGDNSLGDNDNEQLLNISINQDLTLRSLIQSRNDTENNNDSSVTPLKHFQSPKSIYINNASSHTSPDVHIDMKLSIDTNCSNICKSIHSDHNRKWKYQSSTICQTINNNDVDKISDGFTNLSNDYNLLYKNRSASTNERQCRLFIDASACTGNNNIYDEPSISKYSLCNESFLSTSKLEKSGMRKLSPHTTIYQHHHKTNIINRGNFEQNTFLTRSCHRPKGQSNSFDDRLSISRFTQLSEVMTTSSVASSDTQSIHHKESISSTLLINSSSAHSPSTILSVQSPANQSFMVVIDTATSNEFIHTSSLSSSTHTSGSMNWLENNNRLIYSTLDTQLNRNTSNCRSSSASSYYPSNHYHTISTTSFSSPGISSFHTSQLSISPVLSSGSKPPKTFVPTACVLPSTNHRNPSLSVPFLTIKTPRSVISFIVSCFIL